MSDEKTVAAIRDILIASDAVRCDVDSYEPTLYASKLMYHIPAGHCVQVDFNKLAAAIYKAGYRKEEKSMILIEKTQIMGLEPTIRGMRNPMDSWDKSDSEFNVQCGICDSEHYNCDNCPTNPFSANGTDNALIGPNDLDLMLRLARAGSVDGKFRRMIVVYVDITAPLYWWKEFDTYKVGTVANSCSTMHKIHAKEFTLEDFSYEHLCCWGAAPRGNITGNLMDETVSDFSYDYIGALMAIIYALNSARAEFLKRQDKRYWWQMIQLLPSSYNQKRTVMLNYEVLSNIYQHRRNHKLDEWRELCKWIEGLPYSEVITCNVAKKGD